ncbi:hypothetical protein PGTUg99_021876 [Puccinia graminis f. sp. tritici]|uniref:Uncharacterized protein n=1 Tax=Puccinia graminis f. sp. tritici TaxID=56615 RepID=A0A5B0SCI9_PUCGR|nr:hypothetical protein PGTUg99_021876 [Puccinia graminis f. sp. tritici]
MKQEIRHDSILGAASRECFSSPDPEQLISFGGDHPGMETLRPMMNEEGLMDTGKEHIQNLIHES